MDPSEFKAEKEVIPFEDAFLLSDNSVKKRLIMDIVSQDDYRYVALLERTLTDKDADIAHYAASALLEFKRRLSKQIGEYKEMYKRRKDDVCLLRGYLKVLENFLLFYGSDRKKKVHYQKECIGVLNNIVRLEPNDLEIVVKKINFQLELHDIKEATRSCKELMANHGDSEEAYLMSLKLHYLKKDKSSFESVMNELIQSPIQFSPKLLRIVRLWSVKEA